MATVESLMAKLAKLKSPYFTQEDFVMAGVHMRPGEDQVCAMYRLHPHKREHPWWDEVVSGNG